MSWMDQIGSMLQQYTGAGAGQPPANVHDDFDQIAQKAPQDALAHGIGEAFRSDQTPPFGQMVGQLFGNSSGQQRAGLLNQLMASVGPGILSGLGGGALAGLAGGQVTPEQANQIPPAAVQEVAEHAEKSPGVMEQVSSFYAQHPGLVKTLGGAALTIAMAKMAQKQFPGR